MAECTAYTNIIVSNAGVTAANGTYIPYAVEPSYGNTIFTKDGGNSYPRITSTGSLPGNWIIATNIPFPGAPLYTTTEGSIGTNDCPIGLTWSVGAFGSGNIPTVTGTLAASENTFGLPADVVALITSRFGTVANFLRLRNLGYI